MISVNNLAYCYPRGHQVFSNLNFQVGEGEFWGVLGKNGAGKTTLMDLFQGIKYPTEGKISVFGEDPNSLERSEANSYVFLSQDVSLKGNATVEEVLKFHSYFYKSYSREIEKELIDYLHLKPKTLVGALSTGQQKKVQIVAGLASDTKLILIDEITAVLDPETRFRFFAKLSEFHLQRKKTILLATNIAEDLKERANKILFINEGQGSVVVPAMIDGLFRA